MRGTRWGVGVGHVSTRLRGGGDTGFRGDTGAASHLTVGGSPRRWGWLEGFCPNTGRDPGWEGSTSGLAVGVTEVTRVKGSPEEGAQH